MDEEPEPRPPVAYLDPLLERAGSGPFLHLGHWDEPAEPDWDLLAAQQRMNDRLLAMAELDDGQSLLDVGCGLGGTLAGLAAAYPNMKLTGLDIEPRPLELARARVAGGPGERIELIRGDACRLPFPDGGFDRVLCIEAAFHFDSRRSFLGEARRVLRPAGLLALSDILPGPRLGELEQQGALAFAVGAVIQQGTGPWPDFWGREPPIEDLAQSLGFRRCGHFDATRCTLPSYRCFLDERAQPTPGAEPNLSSTERAVTMMQWLQARDMLRVIYLAFER